MSRLNTAALAAALPIVVGYVPVALTFGMAGVGAGLTACQTVAISALVFAGASQFLLIASLHGGASWWGVLAMCALLNARHLLYGAVLMRWLPRSRANPAIAFGLTDEVFALALSKLNGIRDRPGKWLGTVGVCVWLAWVGGTVLGVTAGALLDDYPFFAQVLSFASPALFVALVVQSARREICVAMLLSGAVALAIWYLGQSAGIAILGGAVTGAAGHVLLKRRHA